MKPKTNAIETKFYDDNEDKQNEKRQKKNQIVKMDKYVIY